MKTIEDQIDELLEAQTRFVMAKLREESREKILSLGERVDHLALNLCAQYDLLKQEQ